jgi:hypothetical protein
LLRDGPIRRRINPITDTNVLIGVGVVAAIGVVVTVVRFARRTAVPASAFGKVPSTAQSLPTT